MKRAVVVLPLLLSLGAAQAEEPASDPEHARFSFKEVADGLLRLDSKTGQVSLCGKRAVGWACQALPDDRTVLEGEIGRLQSENSALKRALVSRGLPLPDGVKGPLAGAQPDPDLKVPSDADLDRAMSFLERAWRRLIEIVQNMQREMDNEKGKKPLEQGGHDRKG